VKYVFSTTQTRRYRFPTHTNKLVMDRAEAIASEVFIVELDPGEAPPPIATTIWSRFSIF